MGVKGLSKFLKDKYPQHFKLVHISDFKYRKVAIDLSVYLCNYKASCNDPSNSYDLSWLRALFNLVLTLRASQVHCVFIFEGKAPPEKDDERSKRHQFRDNIQTRIDAIQRDIDLYQSEQTITPELQAFHDKRNIQTSFLMDEKINVDGVNNELNKMRKQLFRITPDDCNKARELFDVMEVPYIDAPAEAETTCADLCLRGEVDAVLTEDTDVLAYGVPLFLSKLDVKTGTCLQINLPELLDEMGLDQAQFLDFCIMCGTDYNKNIYRCGPNKAFSLIQECHSIEAVRDVKGMDVSVLNHVRVRELFTQYQRHTGEVPFCGKPDRGLISQFFFKYSLGIDLDIINTTFYSPKIIVN